MNTLLTNRFRITSGRRLGLAASIMLVLLLLALAPFARAANIERIGQLPNGLCDRLVFKDHYLVLGWQDQLTVLDMSNPLVPQRVSRLTLPNRAAIRGMTLDGDRLYIIKQGWSYYSKLETIDLSHPEAPVLLGNAWVLGYYMATLTVKGNLACIINNGGLALVDVTAPTTTTMQRGFFQAANTIDVATSGSLACLATISGLKVLDVSNPTSPTQVGSLPGMTFHVQMVGDRAYVRRDDGLTIVSLADPAHPAPLNATPFADVSTFAVKGTLLYGLSWQGQLKIMDVADPAHPVAHGGTTLGSMSITSLVEHDGYLLVSGNNNGLELVDVHDPDHPVLTDFYLPGQGYGACFDRQWAYLPQNYGVLTVDLTDPAAPVQRNLYRLPNTLSLTRDGHYLYAVAAPGDSWELMILDASDPTSLTLKGRCPIEYFYTNTMATQAANGMVLAQGIDNRITILDVHDPTTPKVLSHLSYPGPDVSKTTYAVFGPPNWLYVTTQKSSESAVLQVFDISNPASPKVIHSFTIGSCAGLEYRDGALYLTTTDCRTLIFDVREPAYPRLLDLFPRNNNSFMFANTIRQLGNRRVGLRDRYYPGVSWTYTFETMDLYDLTNFDQPQLIGRMPNVMTGGYSINVSGDQAVLLNNPDLSLYRLRADAVPLAILDPARKTQVTGGDQLPVHWRIDKEAAGTAVRFTLIDYYDKATTLGQGVAASGETTTTLRIPVLPAGSYRLRATSTAKPEITAESLLTIDIAGTGVGLFAPAGGETFHPGQTINVDWEGYPAITGAQVRFELWRGWTKVGELGTAAVGDGKTHTPFTVPANLEPDTNYVLLVVSQTNEAVFARNPGSFTIAK